MNSNEQYCQISTVRPISDINHLINATNVVPDKIARYYQVNDVTKFQHDRPIHKGNVDKNNEFKSLWIERTFIEIAEPLPNILRWFEIKRQSVRELPPVEVACETMSNTLKELEDLMNQYKMDNKRNLNPFTMRLKGTIDANVQGGIPKYQEAFFSDAYLNSQDGKDPSVQKLRSLIINIMQVLENALELHGKLAPTEVQPLHKMLVERFNLFRESLNCWGKVRRQKSDSIINTPLPPLPVSAQRSEYEHDETYSQIKSFNGYGSANRKSLDLPDVPPKSGNAGAPPLPPRYTPDKRMSNPQFFESPGDAPNLPRRSQRVPYSVVDISLESDLDYDGESDLMMQRDSGISTNSQQEANNNAYSSSTNSLPMISGYHLPQSVRSHQKTSSNPEEFINPNVVMLQQHAQVHQTDSNESMDYPAPPALPPKGFISSSNQSYEDDESFTNLSSDSTSESLPLPPIPPIQQHFANENGNCQTLPCCEFDPNAEPLPCCVPNVINLDENNDCGECFCDNPPPTNQSCC
jgi:dedicator of cytokinesis protein 3